MNIKKKCLSCHQLYSILDTPFFFGVPFFGTEISWFIKLPARHVEKTSIVLKPIGFVWDE